MNGEGDGVNVSEAHATCKLQMKYSLTQKGPSGELKWSSRLNKSQGAVAGPSS